jgi:hypothetical protein
VPCPGYALLLPISTARYQAPVLRSMTAPCPAPPGSLFLQSVLAYVPARMRACVRPQVMTRRIPAMDAVVSRMRQLQYLPAIWFIMSRKDCDLAAIRAASSTLNSDDEMDVVFGEVESLRWGWLGGWLGSWVAVGRPRTPLPGVAH